MDETLNLLAFDVGNSTVRVLLCRYDGRSVKSETILSEPNETVKVGEYFYWDMLRIFPCSSAACARRAGKRA